jgi:hypothetical protein
MKKLKDLAVKVGTYTKDGQEKGRYRTIGALMQDDRVFSPAGVPSKEGSESILVSMFEPKSYAQPVTAPTNSEPVEEIPF